MLLSAAAAARADVDGVVRGRVTVDGAPRAGVTVTVTGSAVSLATRTDARGTFSFTRVPFGRYAVTARAAGLPDATTTIDVSTDAVADVTLALGPAVIGRAVTALRSVSGSPVSENALGREQIAALPQSRSLNALVETVPGIVRFSYDEPVAHGFHGVTYEIDGAPLPQTAASTFSEVVDPRDVDSLEIFTGAFPAEFGGSRMGALVNIVTRRPTDVPSGVRSTFSAGIGTYGSRFASIGESAKLGNTALFLDLSSQATERALDAPTADAQHDAGSLANVFLRTVTAFGPRDTLAVDVAQRHNAYQIPINTSVTAVDPIVNVAGQDDTQREDSSFVNLSFTHTTRDGNGYVQLLPWWRTSRSVYAGDLANDVQALDYSADDCAPAAPPCPLAGLNQDRRATVAGLRTAYFRTLGSHALKIGLEGSVENFASSETIAHIGAAPFVDNAAQRGTTAAAYVEDNWRPTPAFSLQAGLRYDRSTGFTSGNELQPRIGANLRVGSGTIFHAYFGRIYAAPALEDTRRAAVVIGGGSPSDALPVYDLKPEHDSYAEVGVAQTFRGGVNGYLNAWRRTAWNVLDTTQLFPTPIFAVFNNALGLAHGYELRLQQDVRSVSWFVSATWSQSVAGGISGGTFLFAPDTVSDTGLNPEDHDQTVSAEGAVTKRFAPGLRNYATVGLEYATGYPVAFENGTGRLTPHLTFDLALGRRPEPGSLGFKLAAQNLTDYRYLLKVANGFNTTQWAPGAEVTLAIQAVL